MENQTGTDTAPIPSGPFPQPVQVLPPPQNPPDTTAETWYKATIPRRYWASFIDSLLVLLLVFVTTFITGIILYIVTDTKLVQIVSNLLGSIVAWAYAVLFIWKKGATPGKSLLKIRVVNTGYQPVTFRQALIRETIGKVLSAIVLLLGYLWAIWDKDRQAWHDKLAKTYVVTKIPNDGKNPLWLKVAVILLFLIIPAAAVVTAIVINPVELTKKGRDAVRLSNLADIQETLNMAIITDPNTPLCGTTQPPCTSQSNSGNPNVEKTDGSGWVKANLGAIKRTSTPVLPIDPVNSPTNFYRYCSDGKDWEIETALESESGQKQALNDQGSHPKLYEVGSNLQLCETIHPQ